MANMPNPFQITSELGQKMWDEQKKAEAEGEKIPPFGMRRVEPAEFRKQMENPMVRKATLARLVKEKGGIRQGHREYRRMLEGK